ncbi:MAG: hypothetical protein ACREJ4_06290 [Candidatus Methylomirabilaceae bacterium]
MPTFHRNPLHRLYLYELHRLAYSVKTNAESLFALTEPGPYLAKVDSLIEERVYAVITAAARIQKLVGAGSQQKSESGSRFSFRAARAEYVATLLDGLDVSEIMKTAVRNSLEHFDERLDDAALTLTEIGTRLGIFVTSNLCVWKLDQIESDLPLRLVKIESSMPIHPVRIYEASGRVYHNMDASVNIGKLHAECLEIDRLLTEKGSDIKEYPAGFVAV